MTANCQRALAASLVFDRCQHFAIDVEQRDCSEVRDSRQLVQVLGKLRHSSPLATNHHPDDRPDDRASKRSRQHRGPARWFGANERGPGSARQTSRQEPENPAEHGPAADCSSSPVVAAAMRAVRQADWQQTLTTRTDDRLRWRRTSCQRLACVATSFWTAHQILLASWLAMPVYPDGVNSSSSLLASGGMSSDSMKHRMSSRETRLPRVSSFNFSYGFATP